MNGGGAGGEPVYDPVAVAEVAQEYAWAEEAAVQPQDRIGLPQIFMAGLFMVILLFSWVPGLTLIPQIFTVVYVIVVLIFSYARTGAGGLRLPKEVLMFGLWALWSAMCWPFAVYTEIAQWEVLHDFRMWGLAWILANTVRSRSHLMVVFFTVLTGTCLIATMDLGRIVEVSSIGQRATGGERGELGISNANDLGMLAGLGLLSGLAIFLTVPRRFWLKPVLIGCAALCLYLIWASGSKRQLILVPMLAILAYWFYFRKHMGAGLLPRVGAFVLFLLLLGGSLLFVLNAPFLERLTEFLGVLSGGTSQSQETARLQLLATAYRMWADNPVFGVGPGNFIPLASQYGMPGWMFSSHSDLGQIAAQTGTLGPILYYGMLLMLTVRVLRLHRMPLDEREARMVSILCVWVFIVLLNSPTYQFYSHKMTWFLTAGAIGYVDNLYRRLRGEPLAAMEYVESPA